MIKNDSLKELSKILHLKLNYESLALIFVVFLLACMLAYQFFFNMIILSEFKLFECCNLIYFLLDIETKLLFFLFC